ncbi:heterokaryon incompatibility protein-domain-containing protein [Chaetomium sp. MPI-SDFR-AT-0129]|nr:heterokaryon incompatibility protein-domain-containing protein [Chaetomium sp. MPI-SDFR-AT-0129]
MLSHLRFHRRGPSTSNPTSPLPEQAPAWDATAAAAASAAQREHPHQSPHDVSPRPDARQRSPTSSNFPPTLPPIARVASTGSDHLFAPIPHDEADAPPPPETRPPPPRSTYDEEAKAGFIGGVALENYRKAAQAPQANVPAATATMAGQLPDTQLSRAKPPPPPIDTGVASRPPIQASRQAKSSWFSTPTDLQLGQGAANKRPSGTRLASEPPLVAQSEPQKGRKGLPFLKNPMTSLLMRRKTAQSAADTQPPAPTYDPRIKGTRVHDFSAPRPRKTVSSDGTSLSTEGASSTPAATGDGVTALTPTESPGGVDVTGDGQTFPGAPAEPGRKISSGTVPSERSVLLAAQNDGTSMHTTSSTVSRGTQTVPQSATGSASVRTTASRHLSASRVSRQGSAASAIPKHMKSTSSRFSFDMIGAAEEERLLEERHRQREQERKTDGPDGRFDEFDDDFDYDAMMDDDGLEERIPGVNADYEEEDYLDDPEAEFDPDNDQENFAGFTFQRSNPVSSITSPISTGMLATPRDAAGQDMMYQAALAEAAQMAAASGKFFRSTSPDVLAGLKDAPTDELAGYEDEDPSGGYIDDYADDDVENNFDDFDFDDDAIIAEANASALANDSDGFYGQEFGFYSAPVSQQPSSNSHQPSSSGVLTTENLFQYGGFFGPASANINRSASGRVVREPNLTPITERSEYSNRNSIMSFTLPPAIGNGGSDRNSLTSPGLAQLALLAADDNDSNMSLTALMKLRSRAWGGSQPSLVSSREGSPRSERAPMQMPLDGSAAGGSPFGTVPAHLAGHVRVGSGLSLWSCSEDAEDANNAKGVNGLNNSGLIGSFPTGTGPGDILPPRPGSAGAAVNGSASTSIMNGLGSLPQRPHSLFLPPQTPMTAPLPGTQPPGMNPLTCSPVLERDELEPGPTSPVPDGFALAPALPVRRSEDLAREAATSAELSQHPPQQQQSPPVVRRAAGSAAGMGHRHKGSADSISYRKDEEGGETNGFGMGGTQRCRGCDHPRPRYTGGYASVRSSLGKMRQAAKWGCEVCAILERGVGMYLRDVGDEVEVPGEVKREDSEEDEEKDVELQLDFNLAASRRSLEVVLIGRGVTLSFFASEPVTPYLTTLLPDLPLGLPIPPTTSSPVSLSWAQHQLAHCQTHHPTCRAFASAPLPSRVLDVLPTDDTKSDSANPPPVRLHVSSPGESAPYLALSHCWGHRPFLRTLSGSLEEHQAGIVWERLPRSFQDAIEFTRRLGVRYLWIDSLCIVQDDVEDWRVEASRMAGVYQGAGVVLSAAKAEGAYGGLFAGDEGGEGDDEGGGGREKVGGKVYEVEFTPGEGNDSGSESVNGSSDGGSGAAADDGQQQEKQTIFLRRALSHPHRLLSPYHASASSLPIFTRGWVFQERFLSPRVLHFGRDELSFECLEATVCQCSPAPVPASVREQQQAEGNTSEGSTADPLAICWRRLVADYTLLRLTHDGDIFPAVSGLARRMQEALLLNSDNRNNDNKNNNNPLDLSNPHYLAGLWSPTLLHGDLLWHVDLPPLGYGPHNSPNIPDPTPATPRWGPPQISRPNKWRAPSWSWASVRAPVGFVNVQEGVEPSCEVLDVRCEPVVEGGDELGELREGGSWMVLRGRVVGSRMRFGKGKGGTRKEDGEDIGDGIEGRIRKEIQPFEVAELEVLDGGYLKNLWMDDDCQGLVKEDGTLEEVYLLVAGRKLPRKELLCLVLAKNDTGNDGDSTVTYRRIGLLEVFGGPPRPVAWGWLHELLGKGEDAVVRII